MSIYRLILSIFSVVLTLLGTSAVYSQDFPSKPIRIWSAAAGGGSDFFARLIAQGITGPLGQPVIIENRAALVSQETVARAAPDGYNLIYGGSGMIWAPFLTKVSYDPVRDFAPITMTATTLNVLVVHPSLPVKSVKELIALAKARPGELNYGTGGSPGTSAHLAGELFKSMAGVDIVRVNFKNSPMALNGLRAGEIQVMFSGFAAAMPVVKAGHARALAVTSLTPSALFPGLPTVAASGLPGYEMVSIDFLSAAGGTPAPIINRLNREIVRVLHTAELKEKYFAQGAEATPSTPEQLAAQIKADMTAMGKVIKDAGIKIE